MEQQPIDEWLKELMQQEDPERKMTDKQARIVAAAAEIFARKGFAAASTSEIAQQAGVAEGTIFRHYRTKKDLLLSIVAPVMSRLVTPFVLRDFGRVFEDRYDSFDQFLRAVIENRIIFLKKNMSILKIFVQEVPFHPDLQEQFQKVVIKQVLARMTVIVDRFREDGMLIDLPSSTIIRLAVSTMIGYVIVRAMYGEQEGSQWDDEKERQATIDFIMRGLAVPAP
ncbi:TetR family transcriptional regulator [Paenibacillus cellulosilyticus]|uniref:TetR family transcriptional regulator n=1 Tax=Paenibacillus cellulosilyticus TaxID=375489 RepID=A0A2V2YWL3_9BACL|nr:TetR/AcrR family transcriptional regulator [Paenibacillus cellulosilyticus]PWW06137.1 TetR family transcriptional regulator [Paenibacillus cellulosilyticus]